MDGRSPGASQGVERDSERLVRAVVLPRVLTLHDLAIALGGVSRATVLRYVRDGVIPAAQWLVTSVRRVRGRRTLPPRSTRYWATCVGIGIVLLCALPMDFARRRDNQLALRSAANWLKERTETVEPVGARRLRVAYYAGAPFVALPEPESEPLVAYLRERGVHHLVIDEEHASAYPELRDPERFGLQLIHRVRAAGRSAAIFEMSESVLGNPRPLHRVD